MNRKAGVNLSLNFLIGLIFTGILIVFTFTVIGKFTRINTHPEKDLMKSWVEDISELEEDRFTQLLVMNEADIFTNYAFVFVSKNYGEFEFWSDINIPNSYPFSGRILFTESCTDSACVCLVDVRENKGGIGTCSDLKGVDEVTYSISGYSLEKSGSHASSTTVVVQSLEKGTLPFFVTKYNIVRYPETRSVVYAKLLDDKKLMLCDTRELCLN